MIKKLLVIMLLSSTFSFFYADTQASSYIDFWQKYIQSMQPAQKTYQSYYNRPTYRQPRETVQRVRYSQPRNTNITTQRNEPGLNVYRNELTQPSSTSSITTTVKKIRTKAIYEINEEPVDIMQISFYHRGSSSRSSFVEPAKIDKATFEIIDNSGIVEDTENISLLVNGQEFRFDEHGEVTVQFGNLRLPVNKREALNVGIKVFDPLNTPSVNGNMRIRLADVTAYGESDFDPITTRIVGSRISNTITFDPSIITTANTSSNSINNVQTHSNIYGKMLSAGQSELVMSLELEANYDDFWLDEITLTDVASNGGIDTFVNRIDAINLRTNEKLSSTKFINGKALFDFPQRVLIYRDQALTIGFKVYLKGTLTTSSINNQFRLNVLPADVGIYSANTGNRVSDSNKNFSIKNETFTVAQNGLSIQNNSEPITQLITNANYKTLVNVLDITSFGKKRTAISRMSFDLYPSGLDFAGGTISADDFEIVRISGNRHLDMPHTVVTNGNTAQFTFDDPLEIYRNETTKIGIKVALENTDSNTKGDAIGIRMLGDSQLQVDTLANIQSSGSNFIWSDYSGRPHSTTSSDWMSGYLVPGIPSNAHTIKR
jgi:hypothetical protein